MEEIQVTCRICNQTKQLVCDLNDLRRWKSGEIFIQEISYLSPVEKELLISATCGDCFDNMFGPGEDDESVFEEDEDDDVYEDEEDDESWEEDSYEDEEDSYEDEEDSYEDEEDSYEDQEAPAYGLLDLSQTQQDVMAEICSIVSSFLMHPEPSEEAYAELGEKISLAAEGHSSQFFGNLYDMFHRSGKNK